jgi:hypothetical protein
VTCDLPDGTCIGKFDVCFFFPMGLSALCIGKFNACFLQGDDSKQTSNLFQLALYLVPANIPMHVVV